MPHHTFPITPDGMVVPVVVGLAARDALSLVAAGQSVPMPTATKGVLDSGSNITCVAARILRQLGLPVVQRLTSQTVSGTVRADLYEVSLSITHPTEQAPLLHFDFLTVMEWLPETADIEILLGRDVLAHCLLLVDGRRNDFILGD